MNYPRENTISVILRTAPCCNRVRVCGVWGQGIRHVRGTCHIDNGVEEEKVKVIRDVITREKISVLAYVTMGGLPGLQEMREDSPLNGSCRGDVTRRTKRKMEVSVSELHHPS
jgi:hypothetical protein